MARDRTRILGAMASPRRRSRSGRRALRDLALALVLLVAFVPAALAQFSEVSLTASSTQVGAGDSFYVEVFLDPLAEPPLASWESVLHYDPALVSPAALQLATAIEPLAHTMTAPATPQNTLCTPATCIGGVDLLTQNAATPGTLPLGTYQAPVSPGSVSLDYTPQLIARAHFVVLDSGAPATITSAEPNPAAPYATRFLPPGEFCAIPEGCEFTDWGSVTINAEPPNVPGLGAGGASLVAIGLMLLGAARVRGRAHTR